ncbi:MAG TPA: S8 family serine peptidase [Sporichthya sp.]|nr:S8 family serine peptidase [Sporichthya sp.]
MLATGALAVVGALVALSLHAAPSSGNEARAAALGAKMPGLAAVKAPRNGPGSVIPDSYLISLAAGEPAQVAAEHAALGAQIDRVFHKALRGYTAQMTAAVARRVAADPRVRAVTLDRRISAADQQTPPGIARIGAPLSGTKAGDGAGAVDADIAVLDTGIDINHPDLNVVGGTDCITRGLIGAPLGARQASVGGEMAAPTSEAATDPADYDDTRGHGTHIAGIAAARDNGVGMVGVAPGARLWAVRVLDSSGNGSLGTLVCGIEWVTAHADVIDVANMSLSGLDPDLGCDDGALHEAICRSVTAGVTYTVAAGNSSEDAQDYSPASFDEVITVSALADYDGKPGGRGENPTPLTCPGTDDEFAPFSNFGPDVDMVAPGVCILSTWMGGGYSLLSGTSQAAAHVAGAAALYLASHPDATPAQVRSALIAAGSKDWDSNTDPDSNPDPLVDVEKF